METMMETDSPTPAWKPIMFIGRSDKENVGHDEDDLGGGDDVHANNRNNNNNNKFLQTPCKTNISGGHCKSHTTKSRIFTPTKVLRPPVQQQQQQHRRQQQRMLETRAGRVIMNQQPPSLLLSHGQVGSEKTCSKYYQTPCTTDVLRPKVSLHRRHRFKALHIKVDTCKNDNVNDDDVVEVADDDFGTKMEISPCQENCPPPPPPVTFSFDQQQLPIHHARDECSNPVARTLLSWDDDDDDEDNDNNKKYNRNYSHEDEHDDYDEKEIPPSCPSPPAAIKLRSVPSPFACLARPKAKRPYSATDRYHYSY